ncbi:MAG: hypothetical protein PHN82_02870 [bacterium]|nr:hypothetical protein [bacterium]
MTAAPSAAAEPSCGGGEVPAAVTIMGERKGLRLVILDSADRKIAG